MRGKGERVRRKSRESKTLTLHHLSSLLHDAFIQHRETSMLRTESDGRLFAKGERVEVGGGSGMNLKRKFEYLYKRQTSLHSFQNSDDFP